MPQLNQRLSLLADSVYDRIISLSRKYDAVNLSQGSPDFSPPPELLDALKRVAETGPHQYEPTYGSPRLRAAIAEKEGPDLGRAIDPEREVIISCGGTGVLTDAMMAVLSPGDRAITFSPYYENYEGSAVLSGADPVYVELTPPDMTFDPALLERELKLGAKAIVFCNPSNPSGKVFSLEELEVIARLAVKYDVFVIVDEVYSHIVYKPNKHLSIASLPGMAERTITCSSLSKTFCITGWRIGYAIGPEPVIREMKKVNLYTTLGAPAPLQEAALAGFSLGEEYYTELTGRYTYNRDLFIGGLEKAGFRCLMPQGTFYVLADISEFLRQERFSGFSDLDFAEWLIVNKGVAAIPCSRFFQTVKENRFLRFQFACREETLNEALSRLSGLK